MENYQKLDYLIIGAGPAGLQAAYFMQQQACSYLVLEQAAKAGDFFNQYPRHGQLISINKVYTGIDDAEINLRWDWNSLLCDDDGFKFKNYSKEFFPKASALVEYSHDFAEKYQLNISYNTAVAEIKKLDDFVVTAQNGQQYIAQNLIVATGVHKAFIPDVPGIEFAESYNDVSVNPDDFTNQHVLIIGKGNSAFETADNLVANAASIHLISPNSIKMAWQTHYVGHLRAVNNNILDTYQLKSQNVILDATIQSITKHDYKYRVKIAYAHAEGEIEELEYDRIIACTGFRFDTDIFADDCKPQLCARQKFPLQTSGWESANVPGMFFAGTIMQNLDYKKYMSGFIHGFRYNVQVLCESLLARFQNIPRSQSTLAIDPDAITDFVIQRINSSSALWQQPGFLVDVMSIQPKNNCMSYQELVAMPYVLEHICNNGAHFVISLEFGKEKAVDPFAAERINRTNTANAKRSNFLHPVIRYFENGSLLNEHHVIEDLIGVWKEPEHIEPLLAYFTEQLRQLIS